MSKDNKIKTARAYVSLVIVGATLLTLLLSPWSLRSSYADNLGQAPTSQTYGAAGLDPVTNRTVAYITLPSVIPGNVYTLHDIVRNFTDQPLTLYLTPVNGQTAAYSGDSYTTNFNCAQQVVPGCFIQNVPPQVVVPPRSFLTITYQLVVPTWLVPGDYLAGVEVTDHAIKYEVLNPTPNVEIRSKVISAIDIGVAFTVPGPWVYKLNITGIKFTPFGGVNRLYIHEANTGVKFLHPYGTFSFWPKGKKNEAKTVAVVSSTVLPKQAADLAVNLPGFLPNEYECLVVLHYEPNNTATYACSFNATGSSTPYAHPSNPNPEIRQGCNPSTIPWTKKLLKNEFFWGLLLILALLFGMYVRYERRAKERNDELRRAYR